MYFFFSYLNDTKYAQEWILKTSWPNPLLKNLAKHYFIVGEKGRVTLSGRKLFSISLVYQILKGKCLSCKAFSIQLLAKLSRNKYEKINWVSCTDNPFF